uniref:Secreted endonuclease I n=1 Tax=Magnetococcus massalia (strain MO-1) TaxID=451514 RepID=A0A1S7LDA5_MAGMO|nr:secreted endonuclease I [Candidatus Magnetococcus massalia]
MPKLLSIAWISFFAFLTISVVQAGPATAHKIESFEMAKELLPELYKGHQKSFYCGCAYTESSAIEANSCGYMPRKQTDQGSRMVWAHVVPAQLLGAQRTCWREATCSGKDGQPVQGHGCCSRVDPLFRAMEADLHNLVPAIGELNTDRGHKGFTRVLDEFRHYGACDFEVDFKANQVEPTRQIRGDIARIYWYMRDTYGIRISDRQQRVFEVWVEMDEVDDWERERNRRIMKIQGNGNPYIQ